MNILSKYICKHTNYNVSRKIYEREYAKERAEKGYCGQDLWGIDAWFSDLMPKMLQEFRDNLHSRPCDMTQEHWESELDRMIYLSKQMGKYFDTHDKDEVEKILAAKDEFFKLFSEHFYDLWD